MCSGFGRGVDGRRMLLSPAYACRPRRRSLFTETECQTHCHAEGVAGRCVDAFGGVVAGAQARLEIVLRLEVAFVEEIVYREIEINPAAKTFGDAEIKTCDENFSIQDYCST